MVQTRRAKKTVQAPVPVEIHPGKSSGQASKIVLICFLLSGASGLIYQVVWLRMLTLIFGATSFATSTVLTAFMGGLAIGSIFAGRRVHKLRKPLLTYVALEVGIGIYGLLLLLILPALTSVYGAIWRQFHFSFVFLSLISFVLVALVLLPPTMLMGATLPVLSTYYARSREHLALSVGSLYFVNTLGAVIGASACGFWLLPAIGVTKTVCIAAGVNLTLALLALVPLLKRDGESESQIPIPEKPIPVEGGSRGRLKAVTPESVMASRRAITATLIAFAVSGFVALTYEVVWTRMLALVVGSSVYAFSIMLTTFLTGLTIGGLLSPRLANRSIRPVLYLGLLQAGIGLSAMIGLWLFPELPYMFVQLYKTFANSRSGILFTVRFLVAGSIIVVPTILLGAILPFVIRIVETNKWSVGRVVGDAYTVNTVGAILGAFTAGFLFIPLMGMRNTITAAVVINLILSSILFYVYAGSKRRQQILAFTPLLLLTFLIWRPQWSAAVMASGVFRYAPSYVNMDRDRFMDQVTGKSTTLFYEEGLTSVITVQRQHEHLILKANGKPDASTAGDLPTQVMVGLLPFLVHPNVEKAVVIGMGSGVTSGVVLQTPVKEVTLVELEGAVVKASHQFDQYNYKPLEDPRLHLQVNDGRNYLAVSPEKFDAIVSEPSNPWITGVSNLFTEEYFRSGARRLNPDGVFCQWLQIYEMPVSDVKVLVRTYHKVFPYVYIFRTAEGDLVLLGSLQDRKIDLALLEKQFSNPRIAAVLSRIEVKNTADLLSMLYLGPNEIDAYAGKGLINSDDNAYIEFQSPKQVGLSSDSTVDENENALKLAWRSSLQYISSLNDPIAGSNLMADLSLNRVKTGDLEGALELAKQSVATRETAHGFNVMGEIYLAMEQDQQAINCWNRALQLDPNHFTTLLNFTVYHLVHNQFAAAAPWVDRALKIDPTSARAHHLKALTLEGTGNLAGAVDEFEIAAKNEHYAETLAKFYLEYGTALRNSGRYVESIQILEKYTHLQPDDYQGHYELGYAYQIVGDQQDNTSHLLAAENEYRRAIAISPDFAQAHYGLSNTLRRLGLPEQAQQEFKIYQGIREKNK